MHPNFGKVMLRIRGSLYGNAIADLPGKMIFEDQLHFFQSEQMTQLYITWSFLQKFTF